MRWETWGCVVRILTPSDLGVVQRANMERKTGGREQGGEAKKHPAAFFPILSPPPFVSTSSYSLLLSLYQSVYWCPSFPRLPHAQLLPLSQTPPLEGLLIIWNIHESLFIYAKYFWFECGKKVKTKLTKACLCSMHIRTKCTIVHSSH